MVRARANAGPEGRGRLLGLVQGQARYRDQPAEGHIKRVAVNPGVGTVRCTGSEGRASSCIPSPSVMLKQTLSTRRIMHASWRTRSNCNWRRPAWCSLATLSRTCGGHTRARSAIVSHIFRSITQCGTHSTHYEL